MFCVNIMDSYGKNLEVENMKLLGRQHDAIFGSNNNESHEKQ